MPLSPQVCSSCCFHGATRSDLAFSSPEPFSSILAPAVEGEGSGAISRLSMEEDPSYFSPSANREDIAATTDLPPQLSSPLPAADKSNVVQLA